MTEYSSVYLDTAPIIYALDGVEPYTQNVQSFLFSNFENDCIFSTSSITNTEYLVFPYRKSDFQKITEYERFKSILGIKSVPADDIITKKAAEIRSKYNGIKGMDSIHIATAIKSGCDVFLTNDKQLKQISEIQVLLVSEL